MGIMRINAMMTMRINREEDDDTKDYELNLHVLKPHLVIFVPGALESCACEQRFSDFVH
jgi:hypothetical protein